MRREGHRFLQVSMEQETEAVTYVRTTTTCNNILQYALGSNVDGLTLTSCLIMDDRQQHHQTDVDTILGSSSKQFKRVLTRSWQHLRHNCPEEPTMEHGLTLFPWQLHKRSRFATNSDTCVTAINKEFYILASDIWHNVEPLTLPRNRA